MTLRAKQVAGITLLVVLSTVVLGVWYFGTLANVLLTESRARADLLAHAVYQRSFAVLAAGGEPVASLQQDGGLRSILESSVYATATTYAAIVDTSGLVIAHGDPAAIGRPLDPAADVDDLLTAGVADRIRAIYTPGGRTFELRQHLLLSDGRALGSIRVGLSTLFVRQALEDALVTPALATAVIVVGAMLVAFVLARIALRPIHVIKSGLARLGRGELDVRVDLPPDAEMADLGASFEQLTARLAADRHELAGRAATIERVVDHLEDAVGLFSPEGRVLFANPGMRATLGLPADRPAGPIGDAHPLAVRLARQAAETDDVPPEVVDLPPAGERLVVTHRIADAAGATVGVLAVARNVAYLSQVEATLSYSRKLASLSRLTAGIAHEIKNPLNATAIHLELLKMRVADRPDALEHVGVIASQVRRLDEVVQGFLKFSRPEELTLAPVHLHTLFADLMPVIAAEAGDHVVDVRLDVPPDLPPVSADSALLGQAFLNLALNACQAMPQGGTLRIVARAEPRQRVRIDIEDTGVGLAPDELARIFDLYYTTKEHGSGIGLSLVFRTVQLHDGAIEVESSPGRGTTFRVTLRQAASTASSGPSAAAS